MFISINIPNKGYQNPYSACQLVYGMFHNRTSQELATHSLGGTPRVSSRGMSSSSPVVAFSLHRTKGLVTWQGSPSPWWTGKCLDRVEGEQGRPTSLGTP